MLEDSLAAFREKLQAFCSGQLGPTLVLAAHPDDETIGLGAHLSRLKEVQIVHLTQGAPRDQSLWPQGLADDQAQYARIREQELLNALGLQGILPKQLRCLGAIDQEACMQLESLTRALADMLWSERPTVLVSHPYEGGHPDHDAAAFVAQEAISLLRRQEKPISILRLEMTSYHGPGGVFRDGEFLPDKDSLPARTVQLRPEMQQKKRTMLDAFKSQQATLSLFSVQSESFRIAPQYQFDKAPHEGVLYYEALGWTMTGERWRALAREARLALER